MISDRELGNIGKAVAEIGTAKACTTEPVLKGVKEALVKKGYEGAEAFAAQLVGTDANTELLRVLMICKKYNLGTEAAIKVLDNLTKIESGKWEPLKLRRCIQPIIFGNSIFSFS